MDRRGQCKIRNSVHWPDSLLKDNTSFSCLTESSFPQLPFPLTILNYISLFINIIIQRFNMRIYSGTYQGQISIVEGLPSDISLRSSKQVSENSIRAIAFTQGQLIAGGYDQQLRSINLSNGTEERQSKESLGVINCITQVNQNLTAVGLDNGHIRFWDIKNWACKKNLKQHKKGVTDIKVDAKGLLLVSVAGKQMIFWNISTLKSLYHYKFDFDIEHLLLVQSFEYLFLLGDRTIRQMSTSENKELFRLDLNEKIQCGLIYLDFLLIATEKGNIKVWKHGHFEHCIHFKAHEGRIKSMKVISMDDIDYLITAEANGEISVWDILEFLRGVESISQDYPLEGLKSLSSITIKQRIICIEVLCSTSHQKIKKNREEQQVEEEIKPVDNEDHPKKKKKIQKQEKKVKV